MEIQVTFTCYGPTKQQYSRIAVGEFILKHGPKIRTQDVGNVYIKEKWFAKKAFYGALWMFSKHLNLTQIYMFNKAHLTLNIPNITAVISFLTTVIDSEHSKTTSIH